MSIYDYDITTLAGQELGLDQFQGKVLLLVNTASKCGFTPQYGDLQRLYARYKDQGLEIIGFPCNQFAEQEPGTNAEIGDFCEKNYGVTFLLTDKVDVRGPYAHGIFNELVAQAPFQGFDMNHSHGKLLHKMLEERFPLFLMGDSIKWNFTKFLIDQEGRVIQRFEPTADTLDIEEAIKALL